MTSTDLAIRGNFDVSVIPELQRYSDHICKTEFVPAALRNRPEAVLACIMTGQELGIGPMQSLRQIYNFDGKVGLFAELMRALVLDRGHRIWFGIDSEFTTTRVVCYGKRTDNGDEAKAEWTLDMARSAGIANKPNWKLNPRAMMSARSSTEVCRMLFPDVVAGMGYSIEELQDGVVGFPDDSTVVDAEIVEEPKTTKRTAPARKQAPRKAAAQPAPRAATPEPALPDEDVVVEAEIVEEPAPEPEAPKEPEQTPEEKQRSVQVVKLAKALNLDHHDVVAIVTNGVKRSATRLTPAEATDVMNTLRSINDGRLQIQPSDNNASGFDVFAIEQTPTNEPPLPDEDVVEAEIVEDEGDDNPEDWDSDMWRGYLAAKSVKVIQVLRHASSITPQGQTPVGSLQSIQGSGIAAQIKAFVDNGGSL